MPVQKLLLQQIYFCRKNYKHKASNHMIVRLIKIKLYDINCHLDFFSQQESLE